ncbi:MAG: hypothetical protein EOP84_28115 [Verrucomicrobiaceae bacterium]|nr:MAG: hypothetical protein EOP84_28115 [Verrucomicrobiaceae bacterium]
MVIILSLVGMLYISGFVALLNALRSAPEGYEDESGFRYGTEEEPAMSSATTRSERFHAKPLKQRPFGNLNLRAT